MYAKQVKLSLLSFNDVGFAFRLWLTEFQLFLNAFFDIQLKAKLLLGNLGISTILLLSS